MHCELQVYRVAQDAQDCSLVKRMATRHAVTTVTRPSLAWHAYNSKPVRRFIHSKHLFLSVYVYKHRTIVRVHAVL